MSVTRIYSNAVFKMNIHYEDPVSDLKLIWDHTTEGSAGCQQVLFTSVQRRPFEIIPANLSDFSLC